MKSPSDEERDIRDLISENTRPWGKFRVYPHDKAGSLKIITVNPGASLSLQFHRRRAEFWVVLDDGLEITVGDRTFRPRPNEEVFIPRETPHRLRGVGDRPARVMELWLGNSEEDDIVRLEDLYGRS